MLQHKAFWDSYLSDFINIKFIQSETSPITLNEAVHVISSYFSFKESEDYITCLSRLHISSEIHKAKLNITFEKLRRLNRIITNQHLQFHDVLDSIAPTISTSHDGMSLETTIIKGTYISLCDIADDLEALKEWFVLYKDIVSPSFCYSLCYIIICET